MPSTKIGLGKLAKLVNFGNTGRNDKVPVGGNAPKKVKDQFAKKNDTSKFAEKERKAGKIVDQDFEPSTSGLKLETVELTQN